MIRISLICLHHIRPRVSVAHKVGASERLSPDAPHNYSMTFGQLHYPLASNSIKHSNYRKSSAAATQDVNVTQHRRIWIMYGIGTQFVWMLMNMSWHASHVMIMMAFINSCGIIKYDIYYNLSFSYFTLIVVLPLNYLILIYGLDWSAD